MRCKSDGGFDTLQQWIKIEGLKHEEREWKHILLGCEIGREVIRKVSAITI